MPFKHLSVAVLAIFAGCSLQPSQTVHHLLDWQFVIDENFTADLVDQDETLSPADIARRYSAYLDDVEFVQNEQVAILRSMIGGQCIRRVLGEGVTAANVERFRAAAELPELHRRMVETEDFAEQALLLVTIEECRAKHLELGAVGQLMATDEFNDVLPLEDTETLNATHPPRIDFRWPSSGCH